MLSATKGELCVFLSYSVACNVTFFLNNMHKQVVFLKSFNSVFIIKVYQLPLIWITDIPFKRCRI